jgi:hypothetical protein
MSLKFEAIVLPGTLQDVYVAFCRITTKLTFDLREVGDN